jgi:hypothetical protein
MQFATTRREQAAQHTKCGGFTRTIGPEQPENLAPVHLEVDPIDRNEGTEFFY